LGEVWSPVECKKLEVLPTVDSQEKAYPVGTASFSMEDVLALSWMYLLAPILAYLMTATRLGEMTRLCIFNTLPSPADIGG
jgi:hypothetical protein